MHSRRKFESATVDGAKSGRSLGEAGLGYFKKLYDLEEKIGEKTSDERHRLRLEIAEPIWKEMKKWAEGHQPKVPAKSKIGGAFRYFLNEYEYLTGYLKDGRLEADNALRRERSASMPSEEMRGCFPTPPRGPRPAVSCTASL
jgi:transposase